MGQRRKNAARSPAVATCMHASHAIITNKLARFVLSVSVFTVTRCAGSRRSDTVSRDMITIAGPLHNAVDAGGCVPTRVARSPVFYGRSRISDPFSRLPGGEATGKNKSPVFC